MRKPSQSERLTIIAVAILLLLSSMQRISSLVASGAGSWAAPSAISIKRVSDLPLGQHEFNFLKNLDCQSLTYRYVNSSEMTSGCFAPTDFGYVDADSQTVIYNGSDEGVTLTGYNGLQSLFPWPAASGLIALQPAATGGSYVSLYKNALAATTDKRNLLGQLTGKQISGPPDLKLTDQNGQALLINPSSLAFSPGGYWMAAESMYGAFVRINLASLDAKAFAKAYAPLGSPALQKSIVALSHDGSSVAIYNNQAGEFKLYNLNSCSSPIQTQPYLNCQSYDYLPWLKANMPGLTSIDHIRFISDNLVSFEAYGQAGMSDGVYIMSPSGPIKNLSDYLGLGDSYTAGEGAFDYLIGTDTADNGCHLSINSYPLLLTRDLYGSTGGHSVACSGARINDIGNKSDDYRGQMRGVLSYKQYKDSKPEELESILAEFKAGYLAQQRFAAHWQPKVITVSIGGNDVGFGDILERCVIPKLSPHFSDLTCFNTYEDRLELINLIDKTVNRWSGLFKELAAVSPQSKIYAIGYPQTVSDTGNCAANVHLGKSELEFTLEITDYINKSIASAATKAGVEYVDIAQALYGHRLCETSGYNVAVNGLTAGKDGGPLNVKIFGKESYHPNILGQSLMEQAILKQTNNFAADTQPPSQADSKKLLSAPKTGRTVNKLVPAKITSKSAGKSKTLKVSTKGTPAALKPKTKHTVKLGGQNGRTIGSVTTDENGDIDSEVTIPANVVSGPQTIDILGEDQTDEPVDISQPIYIDENEQDADGDGMDNSQDSCPYAYYTGQDIDYDGIDDACDGSIGPPAGSGSGSDTSPPNIQSSATLISQISLMPIKVWQSEITGQKLAPQTTSYMPASSAVLSQKLVKNYSAPLQNKSPASLAKPKPFNLPILNWYLYSGLAVVAWWLVLIVVRLLLKFRHSKFIK